LYSITYNLSFSIRETTTEKFSHVNAFKFNKRVACKRTQRPTWVNFLPGKSEQKNKLRLFATDVFLIGYDRLSKTLLDKETRVETPASQDRWFSVDEIAIHIGVQRDTVYKWIKRRGMPAHKAGRLWKFRRDEIDVWVRAGQLEPAKNSFKSEGKRD
jgi:excisionase family DNA binding protein